MGRRCPRWTGAGPEAALRSATRRSALGNVRRLEDSLAQVQRSTQAQRAAHRSWLRTRAAGYPLASVLAAVRRRAYERSVGHRARAVAALTRAVPVSLAGLSVRPPDGYAEGLQGLSALAGGAPLDDDTWAAAVADLSRAAERDAPRRTRWLFALAACAELRSDPPARESAARWALDAAALPSRAVGDPRTDPLPDAVALEPVRPGTWEHALRRARANQAGPILLAEVTLRWAYALTGAGETAPEAPADPGEQLVPNARTSAAATEIIPTARDATKRIPADLSGATAAGAVPPRAEPDTVALDPDPVVLDPAARRTAPPPTAPDRTAPDPAGPQPASGPTPGRGSTPPTEAEPSQAELHAAVLDPAVTAAAEIMTETSDPDEYLRRVRPGFEDLGATSAQLSRLVPAWTGPTA